jgi:hypothetical protein
MGAVTQLFGTNNQTITITIASLGSTSARESTVIDNTSNLFMDVKVQVKVKTNAAGTSATGAVNIFAYATADNGTTYSGGATGSDAAYTNNKDALIYLGSLPTVANATTYVSMFNLSRAFGYGGIPAKWGIVLDNQSGAALDATGGSHSAVYQGINATVA